MEWFKKKMRVFLFVCLLFPFYGSVVILGGLIFVNFPLCIHLC